MRIAVVALILLVTLSGCLGGEKAPEQDDDETRPPIEDAGSVQGQVANWILSPVVDARVRLIKVGEQDFYDQTRSDEVGNYSIENVEPGSYRLQVTAPHCCEQDVKEVTVMANEVTKVNFMLDPVANTTRGEPRASQVFEAKGLISCSVNYVASENPAYPCALMDDNHRMGAGDEVKDRGLETVSVVLDWDPAPGSMSNQLTLTMYNQVGGSTPYEAVTGPPPLEIRIDNADLEAETLRFDTYDNPKKPNLALRFQVSVVDPGVVYQQQFELYWQYYFWETAPDGFSPVQDS